MNKNRNSSLTVMYRSDQGLFYCARGDPPSVKNERNDPQLRFNSHAHPLWMFTASGELKMIPKTRDDPSLLEAYFQRFSWLFQAKLGSYVRKREYFKVDDHLFFNTVRYKEGGRKVIRYINEAQSEKCLTSMNTVHRSLTEL